jgi:hypothetical protein
MYVYMYVYIYIYIYIHYTRTIRLFQQDGRHLYLIVTAVSHVLKGPPELSRLLLCHQETNKD